MGTAAFGWKSPFAGLTTDVRYTLRSVVRFRSFAVAALVTLALGIGANAGVFAVIYATLLEPLPLRRPEEMVQLRWIEKDDSGTNFNWPAYRGLVGPTPLLPGLVAQVAHERTVQMGATTDLVRAAAVSGSYHQTLGIDRPFLGRVLTPTDDRAGAPGVAVLSYRYWRRRFADNGAAIGSILYVDGAPLTIVGVTPKDFCGLNPLQPTDLTYPLHAAPLPQGVSHYAQLYARVDSSESDDRLRARANARFRGLLSGDLKRYSDWMSRVRLDPVRAGTGDRDDARARLVAPLLVAGAGVILVLVTCWSNVAALLLARGVARRREMALRLALGAGPWRVVRLLLLEGLLLGAAAGCAGLVVGRYAEPILATTLNIGQLAASHAGWPVPRMLLVLAMSAVTGALCAAAPSRSLVRGGTHALVAAGADVVGWRRWSIQKLLTVVQVAGSVVLALIAILFARTVQNLQAVDLGFRPEHLLAVTVDLPRSRLADGNIAQYVETLRNRIDAVRGAGSASIAVVPLLGAKAFKNVRIDGEAITRSVAYNVITPGFFAAAGITMTAGRDFSARDDPAGEPVAVVNEAFVRRYLRGGTALGRLVSDGGQADSVQRQVVGVVKDTRSDSPRVAPAPTVFTPLYQSPAATRPSRLVVYVRTTAHGSPGGSLVAMAIRSTSPGVLVRDVQPMGNVFSRAISEERALAVAATACAGMVLLLCCVALYGSIAYSVARRAHELGVRIALGAEHRRVLWVTLRGSLALAGLGLLAGAPLALASAKALRGLLFGVAASDWWSVAGASALVVATTILASVPAAWRATRISPIDVLRSV